MAPRIGITTFPTRQAENRFHTLNENYTRAVRAAGGLPLLLPFDLMAEEAADCVAGIDGLLISGGPDISPWQYGEEPLPAVNQVYEMYDHSGLALFQAAATRQLPVFGVCRGCQLVNVALGGSLYQDLPTQCPQVFGHRPTDQPMTELYHEVRIVEADSVMATVFGQPTIRTNSIHHQAISRLASGLRVTAQARDGIIEAVQGIESGWYLHAVQFHPESLTRDYPKFLGLFTDFVAAARLFASDSGLSEQ
ncbi:MAG: hypothetical protein A2087_09615 [Spirochaetes bacterium GWD1_61_31]|nr:MAG: hypothetical protein A2Y37_05295 [Spirochaetes bacterium GWB1_60_80]OHD33242.1 MAG: hypothetical protein A2004_09425 [Spirochaetes bacterium GWC1_61_12]OHD37782.1 MAG: hypothetical protein A2087_09615 [Spirochaetes bacterium GWD1_61_31]OHD42747.1 MAG: hypothetical protein A2Y35_05675 [Spirochaetes bacterium GWE1_60_18]OHD58599.1 MAG: hypothetical protein A2Y32_04600 [Spirochaetes bacterium GWF1_60_12]HAP44432.1 gamma-glutamyl-gamma-aminobutyrate hydrolase [Spirochaetaceae bacterium]